MEGISVYIPTYNRIDFLKKAVDSVVNQTLKPVEIIIVDDNSNDGTWDYLSCLMKSHPGVIAIKKPRNINKGPQESRNIAIRAASGKYVTGLDDDDIFAPDRLSLLKEAYKPSLAFSCSNYLRVKNGKGSVSSYLGRQVGFQDLLVSNCVGNQVFTETHKMRDVGLFDVNLSALQDLDMWLRLTKRYGHGVRIKERTYLQNFDDGLERITFSEKKKEGTFQFIEKYKEHLDKDVIEKRILLLGSTVTLYDKLKVYSLRQILMGILNLLKLG